MEEDTPRPVLLVEDNNDDADLILHAWRRAGIRNAVERADDGEKACARLSDPALPLPGLVLLDLKLPRRSGHEVLGWIRARPEEALRRLVVVVLTSSDQERDVRQSYDLGANSYLVKPVRSQALLDMVRNLNAYWLELNRIPAA